tara:strand:- start:7699 stop:8430 length:732 start_codon:yes stop_codon:yes gene_type:complete
MSDADGQSDSEEREGDVLVAFLLENRTLVNYASIIMIVFAVWATVESITNAFGMTWWPPETGIPADDLYKNPDNVQNINNGWIIGLGAVCGTVGFMIQYFYRAAPYVDASMTATAALILQQATGGVGGGASEEEVIAKAEVAATIAADTVVRQSNEDTIEQAKETAEAAAAAVVEEMMATVKGQVDAVAEKQDAAAEAAVEAAEAAAEAAAASATTEVEEAADDDNDKSSDEGEGLPSNAPKF